MGDRIEVVYNYNDNLIYNLKKEGLLSDLPIINECIENGKTDVCFHVFEGKDNWFVQLDSVFGIEEVIVPKKVSMDSALDISKYIFLKEYCKISSEGCYGEYNKNTDIYNECIEEVNELLCKPASEISYQLKKAGINTLGCYEGDEISSPDIDEVCIFEIV